MSGQAVLSHPKAASNEDWETILQMLNAARAVAALPELEIPSGCARFAKGVTLRPLSFNNSDERFLD
jgi:hypothetical protein